MLKLADSIHRRAYGSLRPGGCGLRDVLPESDVAELKTKQTNNDVREFLNGIADEQRRQDSFALVELMRQATKVDPRLWGTAIVGFGSRHYKYASGREGDICIVGFSPRKLAFALYGLSIAEQPADLLERLGKHKTGKGCLYISRLSDVHQPTLSKLVRQAFRQAK